MKLIRLVLACTLLLLAASPAFALPECADCEWNECVPGPWSVEPCTYDDNGNCYTYPDRCARFAAAPVLADWTVASVEVSRPELTIETAAATEACPPELTPAK